MNGEDSLTLTIKCFSVGMFVDTFRSPYQKPQRYWDNAGVRYDPLLTKNSDN